MPLTSQQKEVIENDSRFRVLVSGRRFGKTFLAINELARFARFPNKYSAQNVLNKVYIFENYESAYDLGSDVTHNDQKISDWAFDNGGDGANKILQEGAREVHIGETNGGVDIFIRINSASANKIYVPATICPM